MNYDDYKMDISDDVIILSGIFRLQSPNIYDELFAPIREKIASGLPVTLNLTNVSFLNSSGITALARLIIVARTHDIALKIDGNHDVPWQKKSLESLKRLWPKLEINIT